MKKYLIVWILVTFLSSCSSIQDCKIKVKPSVVICDSYCKPSEGIYNFNRVSLDGIESKISCQF